MLNLLTYDQKFARSSQSFGSEIRKICKVREAEKSIKKTEVVSVELILKTAHKRFSESCERTFFSTPCELDGESQGRRYRSIPM